MEFADYALAVVALAANGIWGFCRSFPKGGTASDDPTSLCVLGRDEIARETEIGKLLRLN